MEHRISAGWTRRWGWPGTFIDSAQAADFVRTIAESYPLGLNRVITIGHSAGGHLALWLAARNKLSQHSILLNSKHPLPLAGVISLAGVSDLILMHDIHKWRETLYGIVENPTRDFMGGLPNELQSRYEEGSPIALLPIGVPLVLIHGSLDVNVPIGVSEHFEKTAESAGDTVELKSFSKAEHFKLIVPGSEVWPEILNSAVNLLGNLG